MTDDWILIKEAFAKASSLEGPERTAFVERFAAEHVALAGRLQALLAADGDARELSEPIAEAVDSLVEETVDPWIGRQVGAWTIKRRIGEGGMGAVFLASRADEQFDQVVALKLMSSRALSRDAVTRFRAERQFLAKLSHPNIARLLDGGSLEDGQPFLAMDYVDGVPLDLYCDEHQLDVTGRLQLFCKVCDAVAYAHRKLIVHRDLKPSNILVDEHGEPQLLDFGIAKLLDPDSIDQTMLVTRQGMHILTPEYASPEQVRGEPPSIATDVYALGVLLYRLLTGQSPYGPSVRSALELEKAIVDENPKRPSAAVTGSPEQSEQRRTSPERLRKRLLGDLDNIVLKALQKDPERRYATATQLHDDVVNYLERRPVSARPDSFAYRARKFVQRNRVPVAGLSAFLLVIVGLVSFYTVQLAGERDRAQLQAERAGQVTEFLTELFEEASPQHNFGNPMNARELLDKGAEDIAGDLHQQPELRAALILTIVRSYLNMRENKVVIGYLGPLLDGIAAQLGDRNEGYLQLQRSFGEAVHNTGDAVGARPILEDNYAGWQAVADPDSLQMALAARSLGKVYTDLNEPQLALQYFDDSLRILRQLGERHPLEISEGLMTYGVLLRRLNRFEEEQAVLEEALAIQERCCGTEHSAYAGIINNLGTHYLARGKPDKAEFYFREHARMQKALVGENGVAYANALMNLSNSISSRGDSEGALEMLDEAREIYRRGYGDDSVRFAYINENTANVLTDLGRYDEALERFRVSLSIIEAAYGPNHAEYAFTMSNYGNTLVRSGEVEQGLVHLEAALAIFLDAYGADYLDTIRSNLKIANALLLRGDIETAREHALEAVESARRVWPEPHPATVNAVSMLAHTYRDAGMFDAAERAHREAIELAGQIDGDNLRPVIWAEFNYAETLVAAGRVEEARQLLEMRREEIAGFDATWDSLRQKIDELLEQ
jgi:serine/threonine-protein kinase